jgi:hypothetical protein
MEFGAVPKAKAKAVAKKKKKCAEKDLLAVESARRLLPEIGGCTINIETEWHLRFKVAYPTWEPPYGTSMCYQEDDKLGKKTAMLFCLTWAWTHHERQTGEICPYDLTI